MARSLEDIEHVVIVCTGKDCRKRGAKDLKKAAKACLKSCGVFGRSLVIEARCTGRCKDAPVVCHQPSNTWFKRAKAKHFSAELRVLLE